MLKSSQISYQKYAFEAVVVCEIGWAQKVSSLRSREERGRVFMYGDHINNASTRINSLNHLIASVEHPNQTFQSHLIQRLCQSVACASVVQALQFTTRDIFLAIGFWVHASQ